MKSRPVIILGGAVGLLAAGYAVKRLLEMPEIRRRLGLENRSAIDRAIVNDDYVDLASEDSFPASDPPSFSPAITGKGG